MPKIEIMPSILAADMGNLEAAIRQCERAGADQIHMDIMDGVFVPNISMGPAVVSMANGVTNLPMDVHLMLLQPQNHIEAFAKAGADTILIHIETDCDVEDTLKKIRGLGCKSGITVNPPTPVDSIFQCLEKGLADEVLIMSVNPGFGGQSFIHECLPKIQQAAVWRREKKLNYRIEVDGGINNQTVAECARAGADTFVAGTALFSQRNMAAAIKKMRKIAHDNDPALADLKL